MCVHALNVHDVLLWLGGIIVYINEVKGSDKTKENVVH